MPRKERSLKVYEVAVKLSQEITGNKTKSAMPGISKLGIVEFRFLLRRKLAEMKLAREKNKPKKKRRRLSSTGIKGCHFDKNNKFVVQVSVMGKKKSLGTFSTKEEALNARANFIKENNLKVSL